MTDAADKPVEDAATDTDPSPVARPPRRGWIRRWTRRLVIVALLLAVGLRIAIAVWLPDAVHAWAEDVGIDCRIEGFDLSLLGGDLELRHVEVRGIEATDAPAALSVEYARLDVDVSALWAFELRVHRVEVDGVEVRLRHDADGAWSLPGLDVPTEALTEADDAASDQGQAVVAATEPPTRWSLAPPLWLDAFRAQHVRVMLDGVTGQRVFEAQVRVSDLGHPTRRAQLSVQAWGQGVLDQFVVSGAFESSAERLDAELLVSVQGVHPRPLAALLEPMGLRPTAGSIDFGATLDLGVTSASDRRALDVACTLRDVRGAVDGVTELELQSLVVAAQYAPDAVEVESVQVAGVRGVARRTAAGRLRALGIEWTEGGGAGATDPAPPAVAATTTAEAPPKWHVGVVGVQDVDLRFEDAGVSPATTVGLVLEALEVRDVGPGRTPEFEMNGALTPFVAGWKVQGGVRFADDVLVEFAGSAEARGLDLVAADPWLTASGLQGVVQGGYFAAQVHGSWRAPEAAGAPERFSITVSEAALRGTEPVLMVGPARMDVALSDGEAPVVTAQIEGLRVPVTKDAEGRVTVLGVRTGAAVSGAATDEGARSSVPSSMGTGSGAVSGVGTSQAGAAGATSTAAKLRIGTVALVGATIALRDAADSEAFDVGINAAVRDFVLGASETTRGSARLELDCEQVGVVGLAATIESAPGPLDLDVAAELRGSDLDLVPLNGYLELLGLQTDVQRGEVGAKVTAELRQDGDTLHAGLDVRDVHWRRAGEELAALDALSVRGVAVGPTGTVVESVTVDGVRLDARRAQDGTVRAAGFVMVPVAGSAAPAAVSAPAASGALAAPSTPTPSTPAPSAPAAAFELREGVTVQNVAINWVDAAARVPVATTLGARAEIGPVGGGAQTPVLVELQVAGVLDALRIEGSVEASAETGAETGAEAGGGPRFGAQLSVTGSGLRGAPWLAAYLPPGQALDLADGRLGLEVEAEYEPREDRGERARFAIKELTLRDGEAGEPLVRVAEVVADVGRIDLAADEPIVEVTELAVRGVRGVAAGTDGSWAVAGLRFGAAPADSAEQAPAPVVDAAAAPVESDAEVVAPTVRLDALLFEIESFVVRDGDAQPLEWKAEARSEAPMTLISADPEIIEPWRLRVEASSPTALESFAVDVVAQPWRFEPEFTADFEMRGLRGGALEAALPSVALDLSGIESGTASAHLGVRIALRRRSPTEFDLSRGFGLHAELRDFVYRTTPDGPVAAGVQSVFVDAPRIGGASGAIHVAELTIANLEGFARADAEGLHALGLTFGGTPASDEAAAEQAPAQGPEQAAEAGVSSGAGDAESEAAEPLPETTAPAIRVDRVDVHGLAFDFRDETVDPPFVLPLDELSISVAGLRLNTGEDSPPPVRFEALLGTGDVELPARVKSSSMIAGLFASAGRALTGGGDAHQMEMRPFLEEIAVRGAVVPASSLVGTIDIDVSSVELLSVRGLAKQGGVDIGDGVFDGNVEVQMTEGGHVEVQSVFTMRDLVVSEPPGGPISSYLKLPAPLQSVVFVLKNDADEIRVPLDLSIDSEGRVTTGQIASEAVAAFGALVRDAIASSPFRVAGALTNLFGLGGSGELPEAANVVLEYETGAVDVPAGAPDRFETLLDVADDDEIEIVIQPVLGTQDLARASVLAMPDPHDKRALATLLRQRKLALWRQRDAAAATLDVGLRLGDADAVALARVSVRDFDERIGATEQALDEVLALTRPGADKSRDRRARRLALEVAEGRAQRLVTYLTQLGGPSLARRIEVRRPRLPPTDEVERGVLLVTPKRRPD